MQCQPIRFQNEAEVETFIEVVVNVHDMTVSATGFRAGKDGDAEQSVSPSVYAAFVSARVSAFRDVFEQVSFFAEHLSKDHPFGDGNKRTTVKMLIACIRACGIQLDIPDPPDPQNNELYQWIQKLVTGEVSYSQLADFLRSRASASPLEDLL
ncbi:Fic family protein [Bifidobacterium sp. ESL0728]|uniref:Fic family protein n=1 Tax=Bifidobacterium sp. ESL0728 TaxID=2983220 RepID=UPI0023F8C844|nr:Fic family protein [Bifidobacterium sp. ESL0728]WEV58527.1 Fic family protein [Bifidobacterium sp. ESL0728]